MAFWDEWTVSWDDVGDLGHVEAYENPWA
jgi:hypothetical protein